MESEESHPREEGKVEDSEENEALCDMDTEGSSSENETGKKDIEEEIVLDDFYKEEDNEEEDEVEKPVDTKTESKGIIETMNDYLESIFSTEEEHDEEVGFHYIFSVRKYDRFTVFDANCAF